jgi:O-antigen/teichoic acid export membrane protein
VSDAVTASAPRSRTLGPRSATANLVAQALALVAVTLAGMLVARRGGAAVLGEFALLRVLPWLTGVIISAGLPIASTYLLAGEHDRDRRLRPTLTVLAVIGSLVGVGVWLLLTPLLGGVLFPSTPRWLLVFVSATVCTQLITVWAKACCQGAADMRGANLIIVGEEAVFLPAYAVTQVVGLRDITAVVVALVGAGVAAVAISVGRLAVTRFFADPGRPSRSLARKAVVFGARGQLGNLLWLVNLRLDFLLLDALAGPAVLGIYAVATKFAELMRMPATAANYVLYPRFARSPDRAGAEARWLIPRATAATCAASPLLAAAAVVALPVLYGEAFRPAVLLACVLLTGLTVEGGAAVGSAYLWGVGRPGANSIAMGAGVVVTVGLDLLLIPRHAAIGAAVASGAAYVVTACVIMVLTYRLSSGGGAGGRPNGRRTC